MESANQVLVPGATLDLSSYRVEARRELLSMADDAPERDLPPSMRDEEEQPGTALQEAREARIIASLGPVEARDAIEPLPQCVICLVFGS